MEEFTDKIGLQTALAEYKRLSRHLAPTGVISDWWTCRAINPDVGTVEPDPKYAGLLAYADGTNWKPNGSGSEGYWYWSENLAVWVKL